MTDKNNQRIFSYLRRSTKKGEQEASIERQEKHVEQMAKSLGINLNRIEYFIDNGKSGFRGSEYKDSKSESIVRTREGYGAMLTEIRKLKTPCKVLSWAVSRIARDSKEGSAIHNLLGNNNKKERKIEVVHFLDGSVWNEHTPQTKIYSDIGREEESSREKSIWKGQRKIQALELGLYPNEIQAPKGLLNTGVGIKEGGIAGGKLKETELMPYVRKAFEMKALGSSNKDIHSFLALKGIKTGESHMHTALFSNSVYVGYYTDGSSGIQYKLKYESGTPPISKKLFHDAQDNIGKKKAKYGDNQKDYLISKLLKTSDGYRFSGYTKKGKYKYYINGTQNLHISETNIIKEFQNVVSRICYFQYLVFLDVYYNKRINKYKELLSQAEKGERKLEESDINYIKTKYILKEEREHNKEIKLGYDEFLQKLNKSELRNIYSEFKLEETFDVVKGKIKVSNTTSKKIGGYLGLINDSKKEAKESIKKIIRENGSDDLKSSHEEVIEDLKDLRSKIKGIDKKILDAQENSLIHGYGKDVLDRVTSKYNLEKLGLMKQIEGLENNSITSKELDQFAGILLNIFEQADNMHSKGKNKVKREDFLLLMRLTTFELTINPSEALCIELFEGLKKVFYSIGIPEEFEVGTFRRLMNKINLEDLIELKILSSSI